MNCSEAQTLFSEYYDGELKDSPARDALLLHFGECPSCRKEFDAFSRVVEAIRRSGTVTASDGFRDNVIDRISQLPVARFASQQTTRRMASSRFRLLPYAAAAAIFLAVSALFLVSYLSSRDEIDVLTAKVNKLESGAAQRDPLSFADGTASRKVNLAGKEAANGKIPSELAALVGDIVVGNPVRYRGLSIFPLVRERPRNEAASTMALFKGRNLRLTKENDRDLSVSVSNPADVDILCTAGQIVSGKEYDWAVAEDAVIPSGAEVVIRAQPLTVGQGGRSSGRTNGLQYMATPAMQRSLISPEWRTQIWSHSERLAGLFGKMGAYPSYADVCGGDRAQKTIAAYREAFSDILSRGNVVGFAAANGENITFCEFFDESNLLKDRFDETICGLALENEYASNNGVLGGTTRIVSSDAVRRYIEDSVSVAFEKRTSPGSLVVTRNGKGVGFAALRRGELAHAILFRESDFWNRMEGRVAYSLPPNVAQEIIVEFDLKMNKGNRETRIKTISEMAFIDAAGVLDALTRQIDNPDEAVQSAVVRALGQRKEPQSVQYLINAMNCNSHNPAIARDVIDAIILKGEAGIRPLLNQLSSGDYDSSHVVVDNLPRIFSRLDNAQLAEECMNRLASLQEQLTIGPEALGAGMTPAQRLSLVRSLQDAMKRITSTDLNSSNDYHRWWKNNRESFLRQYTREQQ